MSTGISGISGKVLVDTDEYDFGKFTLKKTNKVVDRRSFRSRGHPRRATGQYDQELSLDGNWPTTGSPLSEGEEYLFTCYADTGVTLLLTGIVETLELSNDLDDGPKWRVNVMASTDVHIGVS